jgi:hypothetical protein
MYASVSSGAGSAPGPSSIAVTERVLKIMYVGTVALVSLVSSITTVPRVNLVVILMRNVPELVLENRAPLMATALLENVVTLMANVIQESAVS